MGTCAWNSLPKHLHQHCSLLTLSMFVALPYTVKEKGKRNSQHEVLFPTWLTAAHGYSGAFHVLNLQ